MLSIFRQIVLNPEANLPWTDNNIGVPPYTLFPFVSCGQFDILCVVAGLYFDQ
jgi:hypothetical protein